MSKSCCSSCNCGTESKREKLRWMREIASTAVGEVPIVYTELDSTDLHDGWKVRWGINRMGYKIDPGLYGVGNPTAESPILVTANYKLSFDYLRRELTDVDAWILVLDTKGINVWCAAGKGTFGTAEMIQRIKEARLEQLVSHRKVIVPQLGAPGVAGHEVKKASGFQVVYGPVRASDLPTFLKNEQKAEPEMRKVTFTFKERAVLIPVELRGMIRPLLLILIGLGLVHLLADFAFSWSMFSDFIVVTGSFLIGAVVVPFLLPWIPGRSFTLKGWIMGLIWVALVHLLVQPGLMGSLAYLFLLPPISAYLGFNFTGCTPYTSLSGVKKEMRLGVPVMILSLIIGLIIKLMVIF